MKITIDPEVVKKHGLSMCHFYLLLATREVSFDNFFNVNPLDCWKELFKKGYIVSEKIMKKSGFDLVDSVFNESTSIKNTKKRNTDYLISELQKLWPTGSKDGKYSWKSNKTDIEKKLNKFFEEYGDNYSDEQIINAAKKYVKPFDDSGNRKYQKILKYFIFKNDGSGSILADYLEQIDDDFNYCSDDAELF